MRVYATRTRGYLCRVVPANYLAGLRSLHCDYFPFTRKDRTFVFYVALPLLCAVPRMKQVSFSELSAKTICRVAPARLFCGLTQPAPEVPFLSKRKEPKIRQRGGILFGNTSEGHIPSGTSQGEVLSPCLLRWQANARFCTCHFGQQSTFVERTRYRYRGVSKGVYPFREVFQTSRGQGTRWFLVCSL